MKVTVLGVGLIGGSIGLASSRRLDARVAGYDPDPANLERGLELGALTEVPVWESHERGTNFAATLTGLNPSSPGGLDRVFWKRAKGGYFYLVPDGLQPGALVEFAGRG